MNVIISIGDRLRFLVNRLRERLWIKPLMICVVSIAGVWVSKAIDHTGLHQIVPDISGDSVEALLTLMASSMLVIATLAVASMVSAYASTSNTATPRSVRLVIADDVSQNALSTFVGAFIFSIVSLTAVMNGYFQVAGRFAVFLLSLLVFALVIVTFVRWVDRIARLGRLGTTIEKVEAATVAALARRRDNPTLCGMPADYSKAGARPVFAATVGYVQQVDVAVLQDFASKIDGNVTVAALPGAFATPDRPLAYVSCGGAEVEDAQVKEAFLMGRERLFDDDPRFGLVALSEIAGRALSPAVNDPGTAIVIIGTLVRLFNHWASPADPDASSAQTFDRVAIPVLSVDDMFDDSFTAIARDGAGIFEVQVRLQKAFASLASLDDSAIREAAIRHARMALSRSENALELPEEIAVVRELAKFAVPEE